MYPCSENCINRICDRFNGSCMCNLQDGGKHHQGMLFNEISYIQYSQNDQIRIKIKQATVYIVLAYVQRKETTSSSKSWIVEFVISLVVNIILVCVILIR